MSDMSAVIQPKVDQLTADHLLGVTKTITITSVDIKRGADQPINVHYEGENGLPYRPCKSMARVMVDAWGNDSTQYKGKSLTLYRDPSVKWGGVVVGGIRISHMSHIDRRLVLALTEKKGSKKPFIVEPINGGAPSPAKTSTQPKAAVSAPPTDDVPLTMANNLIASIDAASTHVALEEITAAKRTVDLRARLAEVRPELATKINDAVSSRLADFDRTDGEA